MSSLISRQTSDIGSEKRSSALSAGGDPMKMSKLLVDGKMSSDGSKENSECARPESVCDSWVILIGEKHVSTD